MHSNFFRRRGTLIVFEGLDGGGKSTQVKLLADALHGRGYTTVLTREPTTGEHGRKIREAKSRLPPDEELFLFTSDRREHVSDVILPALNRGDVVICDRYYMSTAAYQGCRGFNVSEVLELNETFAPVPDGVVLIDISPEVSVARIQRVRSTDVFEDVATLKQCRENYLKIAQSRSCVEVFNGDADIGTLQADILEYVLSLLSQTCLDVM